MGAFFGWIGSLLSKAIVGIFGEWQRSRNEQKLGRAEGAAETSTIIAEKADAQAKVNAADRGSASDVARRLRERLAKPGPQ